jgi:hypothetical protein
LDDGVTEFRRAVFLFVPVPAARKHGSLGTPIGPNRLVRRSNKA